MLFKWCPIVSDDMRVVNSIADSIHTTLAERPEVFKEKVYLFPDGCLKLVDQDIIVGYGISHPWMLFSIPPLDTFIGSLPITPDCIYIHDVAVLPSSRGCGVASYYVNYIKALAYCMGISSVALVSVYGTDRLWSRYGFKIVNDSILDVKLKSYGPSAKYMICQ